MYRQVTAHKLPTPGSDHPPLGGIEPPTGGYAREVPEARRCVMAWFEREFIAVPEIRKNQLLYKWPDANIRRFSRVVVNADEIALFVKEGRVVTAMGPGRHRLDADEIPVLGALIDSITGANYYRAELYFVSTREIPGVKFGGRLADIADPVSEQVVTLRVFGEFSLAVRDPGELITSLTGTTDLSEPAAVQSWCANLL